MRSTSRETALLLALLFKRATASRARLSEMTLRKLSGRSQLRGAFIADLRDQLDDFGFAFLEIDRGFAMVPFAALNGAPAITAKKYLPEIAARISKGLSIDFSEIEAALGLNTDSGSDNDEA